MRTTFKKILSFVMTFAMLASLTICANAATFSDVATTHARYTAINTLSDMGIINGYPDGTFLPDKAVTRAEMAKLISSLFKIEAFQVAAKPFSDVEMDYWALNEIQAVKNIGIINGYPDGTFLPANEVTYEQAVKMVVCALNYGAAAEAQKTDGDWSSGYRAIASRIGLSKNATMSNAEPAPRGLIAQLLFNALDIKPAVQVVDGDGNVSYVAGDKPLKDDKFSMESLNNAKIICIPTLNLEDSLTIKDKSIRIQSPSGEKIEMTVKDEKIYDYIGRYVNISYTKDTDGNYALSSYTPLGTSSKIDIKKIKTVSENLMEYYTDEECEKSSKLTITNPTVIYNERVLKNPGDFVNLLSNAIKLDASAGSKKDVALNYFGDVEFVEHTSGVLLKIKSYKTYYMSAAVDSKTFSATLDGRTDKLVMDVKDTVNNVIARKNKLEDKPTFPTTLSISTNSIVTFSESAPNSLGTHYVEYLYNTSKQTGTPTESKDVASAQGKIKQVTIGSQKYLVTNSDAASKMNVDASSTFMIDASGCIVYVTTTTTSNQKFGFYSRIVKNPTGVDTTAEIEFYDPLEDKLFKVEISDKTIIDMVSDGKDSDTLFWMKITGSKIRNTSDFKLAKDVTTSDDENLVSNVVCTDYNTPTGKMVFTNSAYQFTSEGEAPVSIKSPNSKKIFARHESQGNVAFTYTPYSVIADIGYTKPTAYQINKAKNSVMVLVVDKLKSLTEKSPVLVVANDSSSTTIDNNTVRKIKYYDFKTGVASADGSELIILDSVYSSLGLEVGDVFTYFADSDTQQVSIDKESCVYILLKAENLATGHDTSNVKPFLEAKDTANTFKDGFRYHRMLGADLKNHYYNYSLQLPISYDSEKKRLDIARESTNNNFNNNNPVKTFLPSDNLTEVLSPIFDAKKAWDRETLINTIPAFASVYSTSNVKMFVYDSSNSTAPLTVYATPTEEEIASVFGNITTMEAAKPTTAAEIKSKMNSCSLTFTYCTNHTNVLNTIYIIK